MTTNIAKLCEYDLNRITPKLIAEAARSGDEIAKEIYEGDRRRGWAVVAWLALAYAGLVPHLDPDRPLLAFQARGVEPGEVPAPDGEAPSPVVDEVASALEQQAEFQRSMLGRTLPILIEKPGRMPGRLRCGSMSRRKASPANG